MSTTAPSGARSHRCTKASQCTLWRTPYEDLLERLLVATLGLYLRPVVEDCRVNLTCVVVFRYRWLRLI